MNWKDEGYLLSKTNFDENSIIIETFTLDHGKYSGIVYGGSSKKQKKKFLIGNKILLNLRTKNVNKMGYFNYKIKFSFGLKGHQQIFLNHKFII